MSAGSKDEAPQGLPLRCVARVVGASDGHVDASGVFIAGNRLELVPAGQTEGERYEFSCIFDAHATDKEVCETELISLASQLDVGDSGASRPGLSGRRSITVGGGSKELAISYGRMAALIPGAVVASHATSRARCSPSPFPMSATTWTSCSRIHVIHQR